VETTLGPVRVKTWEVDGRLILRAEHDDISRIAASRALSHDDVAARISVEARRVLRLD
jgi:uncharacterized protein (DUF111 family)